MKRSLIRSMLALGLVACEGEPGAQGPVGADGAPGEDGVDGTAGVDGTNGADGVPRSKAEVYVVEESGVIQVNGATNVSASCADSADVLLSGGCSHSSVSGMLYATYPVNAADASQVSGWGCGLWSEDPRESLFLHAYAVCIALE